MQENADPTARSDLERWLNRLVPEGDPFYEHDTEGPTTCRRTSRAALTATSLAIPIKKRSRLALGTWQGIYLWEHRRRGSRRESSCISALENSADIVGREVSADVQVSISAGSWPATPRRQSGARAASAFPGVLRMAGPTPELRERDRPRPAQRAGVHAQHDLRHPRRNRRTRAYDVAGVVAVAQASRCSCVSALLLTADRELVSTSDFGTLYRDVRHDGDSA